MTVRHVFCKKPPIHPLISPPHPLINSLRPRLNRRPFADDIFKCIFLNENEWILPRISLKYVPKVRINNIPALVQIMAWCLPGDKPLSEPMMVSLLTDICVTRPQWVNVRMILSKITNMILATIHLGKHNGLLYGIFVFVYRQCLPFIKSSSLECHFYHEFRIVNLPTNDDIKGTYLKPVLYMQSIC